MSHHHHFDIEISVTRAEGHPRGYFWVTYQCTGCTQTKQKLEARL